MYTKRIFLILFAMGLINIFIAACAPAAEPTTAPAVPTPTPEPVDPAAIAQSFYQAYNAGDLEALMALVAEDVKCRGGCYLTGKDSFRFYIQTDLNKGYQAEISDLKVEGDKVTYRLDIYSNAGFLQISGVETLHIKDDLIILID